MKRKIQSSTKLQLLAGSASMFLLVAGMILGAADILTAQSLPDKEKQTFPAAAEAAPAQKSAPEGFKFGAYEGRANVEIGYRWTSDVRGNFDVYRSMVNLGDGPKLLNADLSLRAPYGEGRFVDHFDLNLNNWGGEPYNTMRLRMGRKDLYEFSADYRNLNYFNYLPSYANPLLGSGQLLGQHSMDITWRTTDLQLKLFPNRKIRPYIAYLRNTAVDSGPTPSFITYDVTGNEIPLFNRWLYSADEYRGGVELLVPKTVLTLEQGYRLLKNDSGANAVANPRGNTTTPFLGQTITLTGVNRGYHDRITLPITKAVVKFMPFENLKVSGRYIYTMSTLDSSLAETDIGNLVNTTSRVVFGSSSDAFNTRAKQPNHLGGFVIEYSPLRRLTLLDRFETRSVHTSGGGLLSTTLFGVRTLTGTPTANQTLNEFINTFIAYDRIENQAEFEFDIGFGLVAHAGHRDATADTTISGELDETPEYASFSRQTGIAGFHFTRGRWLRLSFDYEKNSTAGAITRTTLFDYDRLKFDAKLGSWKNFSVDAKVAFLRNHNPQPDVDWTNHNRDYSVALNYTPSERFFLSLDYSRTNIFSDILIILPATFLPARSLFDERTQGIGGMAGISLYRGSKFEFGYRGILNVGSLPLQYQQPFAGITIPLGNHFAYKTSWQWFGYNEKLGTMQDFGRHMVVFSLAYMY